MKESFIFYRSFYEAIAGLDSRKRLKMYDSIAKLALEEEDNDDCTGECKRLFALIKPQILANTKRYEDGKKGGRPKKEKTTGFNQKKPNENENVNENENENENINLKEKEKEKEKNIQTQKKENDIFLNPTKSFFISEYEKIFSKKPFLSYSDCKRLTELASENKDFQTIIPIALKRLKNIEFADINFTPAASWLLKNNNFERVMNGEFETKKTEMEKIKEKLGI